MRQSVHFLGGIRKVALAIAYDNGMINRHETETDFLSRVDSIIGAEGVYLEDLMQIDQWILTLSDEDIETFAAGEQDEIEKRFHSPNLLEIFNDIFENC